MPATVGAVGTYNRSVGVKIDMDDAIVILSPTDVPLQRRLASEPTNSIKVEWLEEDLTPQSDVVSAVTGTGPWTVTVSDGGIFRVDDVLWKDGAADEVQYLVTAVSGNDLTVSGFAGNSTAPSAADTLVIVGQYRNEGGDPSDARSVERSTNYNYTQMGQEKVEATRTQRKRAMYGGGDPYDHEVEKKFKELAIRFERSLVVGQRVMSGDNKKRFMGGFLFFVTTNAESNTKANVELAINNLLRKTYEAGGTPHTLMVSPAIKSAISAIDADKRRTTRTERTAGEVVDRYESDFGEVNIVVNRFLPKTKGLLIQDEFCKRRVFDAYFHELLAKTGDSDKGQIVGEFTLEVKNEKAHGVLTVTDA